MKLLTDDLGFGDTGAYLLFTPDGTLASSSMDSFDGDETDLDKQDEAPTEPPRDPPSAHHTHIHLHTSTLPPPPTTSTTRTNHTRGRPTRATS